jgi:hypothetical protein
LGKENKKGGKEGGSERERERRKKGPLDHVIALPPTPPSLMARSKFKVATV